MARGSEKHNSKQEQPQAQGAAEDAEAEGELAEPQFSPWHGHVLGNFSWNLVLCLG